METLTQIANKHTVDKGTQHYEAHGYTEIYEQYIYRQAKQKLLEIGIWHFDSIRMWNEYNPKLVVVAVDIDKKVFNYTNGTENAIIFIGDQSDKSFMNYVMDTHPDIDIVIDDGSHNYYDILTSFQIIFPRLKSGGIYFIEDLHAVHAEKERLIASLMLLVNTTDFQLTDCSVFCDGKLLMFVKA